jgi:hypothetical protein
MDEETHVVGRGLSAALIGGLFIFYGLLIAVALNGR